MQITRTPHSFIQLNRALHVIDEYTISLSSNLLCRADQDGQVYGYRPPAAYVAHVTTLAEVRTIALYECHTSCVLQFTAHICEPRVRRYHSSRIIVKHGAIINMYISPWRVQCFTRELEHIRNS